MFLLSAFRNTRINKSKCVNKFIMDSRSKSSRAEIKFLLSYNVENINRYTRMSKSFRSFTKIFSFLHNDLFYRFFSPFRLSFPITLLSRIFSHPFRYLVISSLRYRHCRRQSVSLPSLLCLIEIFSPPIKQWHYFLSNLLVDCIYMLLSIRETRRTVYIALYCV